MGDTDSGIREERGSERMVWIACLCGVSLVENSRRSRRVSKISAIVIVVWFIGVSCNEGKGKKKETKGDREERGQKKGRTKVRVYVCTLLVARTLGVQLSSGVYLVCDRFNL